MRTHKKRITSLILIFYLTMSLGFDNLGYNIKPFEKINAEEITDINLEEGSEVQTSVEDMLPKEEALTIETTEVNVSENINDDAKEDERSTPKKEMEITAIEVDIVNTGTAPFNKGEGVPEPGEDYSATDEYVRSFDDVSYDVTVALNGEELDKTTLYVCLEFPMDDPNVTKYYTWDTGNFKPSDITLENSGTKLTFKIPNFTVGQLYTKSVMLHVLNVPQGHEIKPIVSAWIENDTTVKTCENIKPIYGSTATTFNARIRDGVTNDLYTLDGVDGRLVSVGIATASEPPVNSSKGGFDFPTGKVEMILDLSTRKKDLATNSVTQADITPIIFGYGHNVFRDSRGIDVYSGYLPGGSTNPSNPANNKVLDTGDVLIEEISTNKYKITYENFVIGKHFPTHGQSYWESYNTNYKTFASGAFEFFVPFYEEEGKIYDVLVDYKISSVKYYDVLGNELSDETNLSDNAITRVVYKEEPSIPKDYSISTHTNGNAHLAGDSFWIDSKLSYSAFEYDQYAGGAKLLQVFDGQKYKVNNNLKVYGAYQGDLDCQLYYGVGKLTEEQIVDRDEFDKADISWYTTYKEAKENETEELKITAVAADVKNKLNTNGANTLILANYVTINSDKVSAYEVIPTRSYFTIYEDVERTIGVDNYSHKKYIPPRYDGNGRIISGTGTPSNVGGAGVYIIPFDINLSMSVTDYENGKPKTIYSISDSNEVNWILKPSLVFPKGAEVTDKITVTATIPNGLDFVETSSNLPIESVVKANNGSTIVSWLFELYDCNSPLPEIKFKTEIPLLTADRSRFTVSSSATIDCSNQNIWKSASASYGITVLNDASFKISKNVDKMLTVVNKSFKYTLNWSNNGIREYYDSEMLDILPTNVNGTIDTFEGSYIIESVKVPENIQVYYTNQDPNTIKFNPLDTGVTDWKPLEAGVTATAIKWSVPVVEAKSKESIELVISPTGNIGGDLYTNRFTARMEKLNAILYSNTVKTEVKKDLIVTSMRIYDSNLTQFDYSDDILVAEIIREGVSDKISVNYPDENYTKLKNNTIYRIESDVYNSSKFETKALLNDSQNAAINYKFLYGADAVDVEGNGMYKFINGNVNYLGRAIAPRETVTFNYNYYIPLSKKDKISIHSNINYAHFTANDNLDLDNDGMSAIFEIENTSNWDIVNETGDIIAEETYLIDEKGNKIDTINIGDKVKAVYKAKYEGPTIPEEYIIIGYDPVTNSPIYEKIEHSYVIEAKGEIRTMLSGNSDIKYEQWLAASTVEGGKPESISLVDGQYVYFTSEEIPIASPYVESDLTLYNVNEKINDSTENDTFNFERKEEYNLIAQNVKVTPSTEITKDLKEVNAIVQYDIFYDVPKGVNDDHAIMVDTNVTFGNSSKIVRKLVVPGNNTFKIAMTADISDINVEEIGVGTLNAAVDVNVGRINYEYLKDNSEYKDNLMSTTALDSGLHLLRTGDIDTYDTNTISRNVIVSEKLYNTEYLNIKGFKYPVYRVYNISNSSIYYNESFKIAKVEFKSKETVDKGLGKDKDGWVELNYSTKGEIKAGYGYNLRIYVEYTNNLPDIGNGVSDEGINVEKGKVNFPNDILVEFKNDKYSKLGIGSNDAFSLMKVEEDSDNHKYVVYENPSNSKIFIDDNLKNQDIQINVKTPIISGIDYSDDNYKLGDKNSYKITIKGSYLDEVNSSLEN